MDWKKKIAAVVFLLSLVCVPVAAFLLSDQAVSKTERRKLAKKPAFTVAAFWDGTYMEQLETYFSEQNKKHVKSSSNGSPINPAQNWNYEKNGYRFQGFPYTCK